MGYDIKAVILAAGKGSRLQTEVSDLPKVMRLACGKPLLSYVTGALSFINAEDIIIVAGYKKEDVMAHFTGFSFAEQTEQLGTGHAVMASQLLLSEYTGSVLVCCGDMPLLRRETYEHLTQTHFDDGNDCTILTGSSSSPLPYGRVTRDADGNFTKIVEERDLTEAERGVTELNSGVYIFRAPLLFSALKAIKSDNSQGEYYLTDVPAIMRERSAKIGICYRELGDEIIGVNTPEQLREVEDILAALT